MKERSRITPLKFQVVIVQPGLRVSKINEEGLKLLGSTALFIKKTTIADLVVIGSKQDEKLTTFDFSNIKQRIEYAIKMMEKARKESKL